LLLMLFSALIMASVDISEGASAVISCVCLSLGALAGGFAAAKPAESLRVEITDELLSKLPEQKRGSLISVLAQDPRPAYQNDPERVYGLCFAGFDLHFRVNGDVLTVLDLSRGNK